jgi:hypothetical protein
VFKKRNCVQNVSELMLYKASEHYTVIYVTNKNMFKIFRGWYFIRPLNTTQLCIYAKPYTSPDLDQHRHNKK